LGRQVWPPVHNIVENWPALSPCRRESKAAGVCTKRRRDRLKKRRPLSQRVTPDFKSTGTHGGVSIDVVASSELRRGSERNEKRQRREMQCQGGGQSTGKKARRIRGPSE